MQSSSSSSSSSLPSSAYSLDPQLFSRIQPAEYLSRFLAQSYRPDGRPVSIISNDTPSSASSSSSSSSWRGVEINVGSISSADGSALVKLGQTTLLCGIRAEIAEPDLLAPAHGFLVPNIDLPPLCSSSFRPGPPSDQAQLLSHRILTILLQSNLLPLSSLCIEPGKAVWCLYLDLMVINHDGGLLDAAVLASVAALRNTRIPRAIFDQDTLQAVCESREEPLVPLRLSPISSSILAFSFALTPEPTSLLVPDPTAFEAPLGSTHFTVVLDSKSRVRWIWQAGGASDKSAGMLQRCLSEAKRRYTALKAILDGAVDEAEGRRE